MLNITDSSYVNVRPLYIIHYTRTYDRIILSTTLVNFLLWKQCVAILFSNLYICFSSLLLLSGEHFRAWYEQLLSNHFHVILVPTIRSVDRDFLFILRNRIIYEFILHFLVITGKKTNKQTNNKPTTIFKEKPHKNKKS